MEYQPEESQVDHLGIEYLISLQTEKSFTCNFDNFRINLKLIGDKNESNGVFLTKANMVSCQRIQASNGTNRNGFMFNFRIELPDLGKVKQLIWVSSENINEQEANLLYEIQLQVPYRNELIIFPVEKVINKNLHLKLEPNLRPGETGTHYVICTHSGIKHPGNSAKSDLNIEIQIIGDKARTKFIRLQHSQLNKQPFVPGKKDIFDVFATDVGKISKVVIGNHKQLSNDWLLDSLEIRTLHNSTEIYHFKVDNNLLITNEHNLILYPKTKCEIDYVVLIRSIDQESEKHLAYHDLLRSKSSNIEMYLVIFGEKGWTKKININPYEFSTNLPTTNVNSISKSHSQNDLKKRERLFQFKSDDVGKIKSIEFSVNEDENLLNSFFIDFIEIKIPIRSEAFKFPIERSIGLYSEDGKCELSLEVWKHPERKALVDYNISIETSQETSKEARGRIYVIFHGEKFHTGKLLLSEASNEHKQLENHEIKAIDVGKITKLELFYYPNLNLSSSWAAWHLESIQIRVTSRNEAYKFPISCWLSEKLSYLELTPWKKPQY